MGCLGNYYYELLSSKKVSDGFCVGALNCERVRNPTGALSFLITCTEEAYTLKSYILVFLLKEVCDSGRGVVIGSDF